MNVQSPVRPCLSLGVDLDTSTIINRTNEMTYNSQHSFNHVASLSCVLIVEFIESKAEAEVRVGVGVGVRHATLTWPACIRNF
jgi:hypothetical protein